MFSNFCRKIFIVLLQFLILWNILKCTVYIKLTFKKINNSEINNSIEFKSRNLSIFMVLNTH